MNLHGNIAYLEFCWHIVLRGIEAGYTRPQDWIKHSTTEDSIHMPKFERLDDFYGWILHELFEASKQKPAENEQELLAWLHEEPPTEEDNTQQGEIAIDQENVNEAGTDE